MVNNTHKCRKPYLPCTINIMAVKDMFPWGGVVCPDNNLGDTVLRCYFLGSLGNVLDLHPAHGAADHSPFPPYRPGCRCLIMESPVTKISAAVVA